MFFSNKSTSKNRKSEKKRNRNIYGIFGRSDSDDSDSGDVERFKPILKDSDSSPDDYESDNSENYSKYKKNTKKNKYNKGYNKINISKNKKKPKRTDFLGFVSGGTLNLSQIDSSPPTATKDQFTEENQHEDYNSDMELNSDEELISQVIDYDDYVLVEEDEQLLMEKRKQLQMEKRMREQYDSNFQTTSYKDNPYEELLPADNGPLKEDKMKKIYGKGLNMLKKMGYKGGGLGREGKGLVNPLSFSSSKDNSSLYKIEELDKHERLSQSKLSYTGLSPDNKEGQVQSTGISEGDNWLKWLNKRYNESLNKKEQVENKRKEINKLNLRLNEEIKLLNIEIQRKLKLLEDFEILKPKIENKYKEFIEILNYRNNNNSNRDSNNSSNVNNNNEREIENKTQRNEDNNNTKQKQLDEIVDKLIKLLKLLNKVQYENKMKRVILKLTFKNLFDNNFKSDVYNNINRYERFLESLPVINSYYCYFGDDMDYKNVLTCDVSNMGSGTGGRLLTSTSEKDNNNEEIKDLINYYVINSLMEYYRDNWNPVDVEKGLNLYQYVHNYLFRFYEDTNNKINSNDKDNNNDLDSSNVNDSNYTNGKNISRDIGLNVLLNEINRKLVDYMRKLNDTKGIYNCHMFIFPWLEYFQGKQINQLVEVFLECLFNSKNVLVVNKDESKYIHKSNTSNINNNNITNNDFCTDHDTDTETIDNFLFSNVEIYENIYNNWNKLMLDKKEFGNKIYDKLYNQLSSLNMSLIFTLNVNHTEDNNKDTNITNNTNKNLDLDKDDNNTNNSNNNNKLKLNELINNILKWNKLVDEETMVKLLFNTTLLKFKQFLVQSLSLLSRNYDEYQNNNTNNNNNEYSKESKKQREKIVEFYIYFKSLLPNYVKNNKNVQEHCFKVVLKKMESFVNCYSNTGIENNNNRNNSNNNDSSNVNDSKYNREYESEESSVSGNEDY